LLLNTIFSIYETYKCCKKCRVNEHLFFLKSTAATCNLIPLEVSSIYSFTADLFTDKALSYVVYHKQTIRGGFYPVYKLLVHYFVKKGTFAIAMWRQAYLFVFTFIIRLKC